MTARLVVLACLVSLASCAHRDGSAAREQLQVGGRVKLAGPVPSPQQIDVPAGLRAVFPTGIEWSPYRVSADGGLSEVVVVVLNPPASPAAAVSTQALVISNTLCEPRVMAVQTHQPIEIQVQGKRMLNLSATSKTEKGWNVAVAGDGTFVKRFEQPNSQVRITDNVHPWLNANISVFDHPWFTVTDGDGTFRLPPLPPGRYTIQATHRKAGVATFEVDLAATELNVVMTLPTPI